MNIEQAINRGKNMFAVAFVAISGIAFIPEVFTESEKLYKIDDLTIFLLGAAALWWYTTGSNRFKRSLVPPGIITLAFLVKMIWMAIEIKDIADAGDDIGGHILLVLAMIVVWWQYARREKLSKV